MKPVNQWKKEKVIEFLKSVDKKTWLTGMVVLVGVGLLWFTLIAPAWIERPQLRSRLQAMDAQVRQFGDLSQRRKIWKQNEAAFGKIIQEARAKIYKEGESALLLGQVSKIAENAGADIVASKPRIDKVVFPAPFQDRFRAVNYDLTMRGGYHALGKLTAGIESQSRLLRIQSLQILPVADDPEKQTVQYCLSVISAASAPVATADKKAKKVENSKTK